MFSELDPRTALERSSARITTDWDTVNRWCEAVHLPYDVRRTDGSGRPSASLYSAQVGGMTVSRFGYGAPVVLERFRPETGVVVVLTTIQGWTRHWVSRKSTVDLTAGGTFVVDFDRTDYRLATDADDMQINVTIPRQLLSDLAFRWWGTVPDRRLWEHRCAVGGLGSGWLDLLRYVVTTLNSASNNGLLDRVGVNLQELMGVQLLGEWADRAGIELGAKAEVAAPGYVRRAAQYIDAHARELPTVSEVARECGVSVRALSGAFRRYLGLSPRDYLREQRLLGVLRELSSPEATTTVSTAAGAWGYVNLGVFAAAYRERFGERPSDTLRRGRD